MAFNRTAAKKAGYSDTEIDSYIASKGSISGGGKDNIVTNIIRTLGGGTVSDISGLGFEPGRQARIAMGQPDVEENPFFSSQQARGFEKNPVKEVGSSALNDVLGALGLLTTLGTVSTIAPYTTKQGVYGKVQKAAAKTPTTVPSADVATKAIESATKTYGGQKIPELTRQQLMERGFIGQPGLGETTSRTVPELLESRGQISRTLGSRGFIQKLLGGMSEEDQALSQIGRTLSNIIHQEAPGTKIPDWLYSLYAKIGDIPSLAKKGIIIEGARRLFGPTIGRTTRALE